MTDVQRRGPGWTGGVGLLCLAYALGVMLFLLPPAPTLVVWVLTVAGGLLVAFSVLRSWRSAA